MLNHLSISQFAIIDKTEIDFQSGFTVLSGETGAGKSILIDAISLLIGERADSSMIRSGAEKSDIQAQFSQIPDELHRQLLEQELIDDDNPEQTLIRRTIREKGSKAFINGQSSTSATLKNLSPYLINIHGQHANQALLDSSEQRNRLDRYGQHEDLLNKVKLAFHQWQRYVNELESIKNDQAQKKEKLELLEFQLHLFDQIMPKQNEFSELSEQQTLLASAESILLQGNQLSQLLKDADESLSQQIYHAQQMAEKLSKHKNFSEINELLSQASIYIDEAYDTLSNALHPIEYDPEQLALINERMNALHQLAKRHQIEADHLEEEHQRLKTQFATLNDSDQQLEDLEKKAKQAAQNYQELADKLTLLRQKTAKKLSHEIEAWIQQLGMSRALFHIEITKNNSPNQYGKDLVQYLLCANPGQSLQPLTKVASGGELSRISLAIEVASVAERNIPETLIFDEIDTGIGGEVAHTIGKLLKKLSQNRQVLCITHLPQVAVWADHHFYIEKTSDTNNTQTQIIPLDKERRIIEIARMLGDGKSKTSQEHATAMIHQCQSETL